MTTSEELRQYVDYYIDRKMHQCQNSTETVKRDDYMDSIIQLYNRVYQRRDQYAAKSSSSCPSPLVEDLYIDNSFTENNRVDDDYNSARNDDTRHANGYNDDDNYDNDDENDIKDDVEMELVENGDNDDAIIRDIIDLSSSHIVEENIIVEEIIVVENDVGGNNDDVSGVESNYSQRRNNNDDDAGQSYSAILADALSNLGFNRVNAKSILTRRERYFVDFDPYASVTRLVESYNATLYKRAMKCKKSLSIVEYEDLGALVFKLATCDHRNATVCLLHNDSSFVHALFSCIAGTDYSSDEATLRVKTRLFEAFNSYVDSFDALNYNGYVFVDDERIRALYSHPRKYDVLVCPTVYKFLKQFGDRAGNAHVVVSAPLRDSVRAYFDETVVREMREIARAFVREKWTGSALRLLEQTSRTSRRPRPINAAPKYVTGTACCGKTRMLKYLSDTKGWCTASRGDLGSFSGKCLSPAYVASLHASLDYALRHYAAGIIGDRGPLDNYAWSFIMPMFGVLAQLALYDEYADDLKDRVADTLIDAFIEFCVSTQNSLTLDYHRDYDVLIMVDPYSSLVHRRMLSRLEDNDAHRARVPHYALIQNVAYWCLAKVFGYRVLAMPYRDVVMTTDTATQTEHFQRREDYEKLGKVQRQLADEYYGHADTVTAAKARKRIAETARTTKDAVPYFLRDTTYQRIIGIHK